MPSDFTPTSIVMNPLVYSVFIIGSEEGGDFPPPGTKFMITETSIQMVDETGSKMITES